MKKLHLNNNVLRYGLMGLTLAALGFILWSVFGSGWLDPTLPERFPHWVSYTALLVLAGAAALGLLWLKRMGRRVTVPAAVRRWIPAALFAAALASSLVLIWLTDLVPRGDYEGYYRIASAISRGETHTPLYISMFPHTVAFPTVLAPLFALFGPSVTVAQCLGAALSAGSVALCYLLLKTLSGQETTALLGAGLWLCLPSRVFYSVLLCTENLFHLLALALGLLFFTLCQRKRLGLAAAGFAVLGVGLAALSAVRPNGLILLIAMGIMTVCFTQRRARRWEKPALLAVMLALFLLTNSAIHTLIETQYVHGETAKTTYGWNLAIGMNQESSGRWNPTDSEEFGRLLPELGAEQTQKFYLEKGVERLETLWEKGEFWSFLRHKMAGMWFSDHDAFDYFGPAQTGAGRVTLNSQSKLWHLLFDGGYLVVVLLAGWSVVQSLLRRRVSPMLLLGGLFLIGTFCLHLPMEAALRYKHHAVLLMCAMAAMGTWPERGDRKD